MKLLKILLSLFLIKNSGCHWTPIQKLFDWNDKNGPATEIETKIAGIDVAGTIATVRLESDNWTGHKFTDFFTLLKVDGEWKIMNKVFYLHA